MVDLSYGRMLITRVGQGCLHSRSVLWKDVDHVNNLSGWIVLGIAPHSQRIPLQRLSSSSPNYVLRSPNYVLRVLKL